MEQKKSKSYVNAKIYRIVCNVSGLQYIGSTCRTLSARLSGHKSVFKRFLNGNIVKKKYISSFEVLKNDNFDIIQVVEDSINLYNFNVTTREKLNMFSKGYQQMKEYFEK